jgi:Cd2+/Zn2+-exporting ATPase/Cu+-exporting ATPase
MTTAKGLLAGTGRASAPWHSGVSKPKPNDDWFTNLMSHLWQEVLKKIIRDRLYGIQHLMASEHTLEIPIQGMDCAECTRHVQQAIAGVPDVQSVDVLLGAEKAVIRHTGHQPDLQAIKLAVQAAGYAVPDERAGSAAAKTETAFGRPVLVFFGVVFGAILFIVVVGEWLGVFESLTNRLPWPVWLTLVLAGGYPVFRNVLRAAWQRQIIAHTLMTVGVLAALVIGEWATALVVVFFMRVGDYVERFTAERARQAVKGLTALAPQTARVVIDGQEQEVPLTEVQVGDTVLVRPGEMIPVDGQVQRGEASVDQATITGESLPVEVEPGSQVYATTLAHLGSLWVKATHIGEDTTFGRVIQLVEAAEANRADVQRIADRFSTYYLPLVAGVAALTFLVRRDPLATAAVLVVACSCAFALATPIAMLASIGAGAKRGLLIKGGKYLETLAKADVLLIDKTGTLTLGQPEITDILPLNGLSANDLLTLAASAERYAEHPLAGAVGAAARQRDLQLYEPEAFQTLPGFGVRAQINGATITVGSQRLIGAGREVGTPSGRAQTISALESQGKTTLLVKRDDELIGVLAAADTLRPDTPAAITRLKTLGFKQIEVLTGDNPHTAARVGEQLGVAFRAELRPEDKIKAVKDYQSRGHTVIMVGDGVNDAPALAQADIGIAMGAAGSDVAIEAAHIALLGDDWGLVPEVVSLARRTMRVVKLNIAFTGIYNLLGLTLAAFGFIPPILAAAAQSLPDLGILANSARLLREK